MRYLLVLGLFCNVYRKKPRIRLFFNNQLVDEFNMPHQPKNKNLINPRINLKHLLQPLTQKMQIEYAEKCLPPLLFYHIDVDNQITQTQIRIDIDNNDSNYNNNNYNIILIIIIVIIILRFRFKFALKLKDYDIVNGGDHIRKEPNLFLF